MDLLDKAVQMSSGLLSMKRRIEFVRKYRVWRHGELLDGRRRAYARWSRPGTALPRLEDGFAIDLSRQLPHLDRVLSDAAKIIGENRNPPVKKDYLINHLMPADFNTYPSFLDFATSDEMTAVAAEYLQMIPVLSVVELWKSNRGDVPEIGSQLFHLDNADEKQVKVFVHLCDIGMETGPLTFLPASTSERVCRKLEYGKVKGVHRLTDDEVFSVARKDELKICAYPAGAVVFVDTIRCLHYGSRRNEAPRYVLMCQYLSPCRADFRQHSFSEYSRAGDPETRKLLLDPQLLA